MLPTSSSISFRGVVCCSTALAPWHVIPADHKWAARALVSGVVSRAVTDLDLEPPKLTPERKKILAAARKKLMSE